MFGVDFSEVGFVGLNNIKQNDYMNVVMHALAHVAPLRNYFMLEDLSSKTELGICRLIDFVSRTRILTHHF